MTSGAPDSEYTQFGTLKVAEPAASPQVLDVLVAGGGPGGSAAALRARELGLATVVIDADDLLTKIRDFHEGKDIEPDYGRGSEGKPFPPGGALVTALHFEKWKREEMLSRWRGFYKEHSITARIGAELTGLERQADGVWLAKVWSRRGGQELAYRARNVILALGGSVARRFDIPGDLNGINFRLDRAENFVGGPALVVGGGISAAEAVIAISNAKVKDSDRTAVYWSYHGEALPRVAESKALGAAFYDAYVGNGNIRYLARSDPAAIFAGPDDRDYLSVRIDRKIIEGRPIESVHLEFAKERVIACIGADLPFQLIESLGAKVPMVNDQRWMLINQDGELSLPNVFLIGDARGGKFLRCTDFNNQDTWEWITGPAVNRNIKNAMWEGVLAVETIAVRAGNAAAKVALLAAPALTGKRLEGAAAAAAAPAAKAKGAAATRRPRRRPPSRRPPPHQRRRPSPPRRRPRSSARTSRRKRRSRRAPWRSSRACCRTAASKRSSRSARRRPPSAAAAPTSAARATSTCRTCTPRWCSAATTTCSRTPAAAPAPGCACRASRAARSPRATWCGWARRSSWPARAPTAGRWRTTTARATSGAATRSASAASSSAAAPASRSTRATPACRAATRSSAPTRMASRCSTWRARTARWCG
jgi:thioredoxin reductase